MAVFIVADPGATWCVPGESQTRSFARAVGLIHTAARAGADAIKWQVYNESLYPPGSAERELITPYILPRHWIPALHRQCISDGIEFAATPFDLEAVRLLDGHVRRWKVASFETSHRPLLRAIASTGKPVIVSTGMLTQAQARRLRATAGRLITEFGHQPDVTLLHCVSAYPAPAEEMNLSCLPRLFGHGGKFGLSDHSIGHHAAVMAVALGASVIEKHLRATDTPPDNLDYVHSASPRDFNAYVAAIREAESMLGDGQKRPTAGELEWQWARYNPRRRTRGTKVP